MITVITGLTGSGKTFLMSRLALRERKLGAIIYTNVSFNFPNDNEGVIRWHNLGETFTLNNGVICIDEAQKLFDARQWASLPMTFAEKIASHRHQFLDIITTTQSFNHLDLRIRDNCHEIINCVSLFRYPKNDRYKPFLQIIKVVRKIRADGDNNNIIWRKVAQKPLFISRFWTKELYNTHANIDLSHLICQIKRDKKNWTIYLTSRELKHHRRLLS